MSPKQQYISPARQALLDHHAHTGVLSGALSFLNPTRARFDVTPAQAASRLAQAIGAQPNGDATTSEERADTLKNAQFEWRARDNRKGRHVLILPKDYDLPESASLSRSWSHVGRVLWRMLTVWAWWDVSWWIAVLFSWGSAIFVICGFFYWLPLAAPKSTFPNEAGLGGGLTAFIGATMFTIGGVLLIVEASNENQTDCFGWALEHTFTHHKHDSDNEADGATKQNAQPQLVKDDCNHHHQQGLHKAESAHMQHPAAGRKWEWAPTWHELTTHYFHETGFLASFILAIGAVIFYVSGIMAIPQIYDNVSKPALYGTYWLAYLVGGILFVVSSVLYMLEVQKHWYMPAPSSIGWWIGLNNLIGSVGWTVSASFGYCSAHWCEYQSDLSLIWASIAFLIGSLLLWYESMDKYVVERAKK